MGLQVGVTFNGLAQQLVADDLTLSDNRLGLALLPVCHAGTSGSCSAAITDVVLVGVSASPGCACNASDADVAATPLPVATDEYLLTGCGSR